MKDSKNWSDIGVVIGRFQVPELHVGHVGVLSSIYDNCKKTIVFLGVSPVLGSKRNPLDFDSRKKMVQAKFPEAIILPLPDQKCDHKWSHNLDSRIKEACPKGTVKLYGSRDSFMLHYHGIHETCELEQTSFVSGTQIRAAAALAANNSVDFRRGIVYGSYNQYDKVESTGDIVVYDVEKKRVLVGRKPAEDGYRLPGGFIQPGETHDAGARRELREEAGSFEVDTLEYVGSYVIDDWRYRNEANKITTILYLAPYLFGPIEAGDDLSEVKWVTLQQLQGMLDGSGSPALGTIEDTHQALLIAAVDYINKTQRGL